MSRSGGDPLPWLRIALVEQCLGQGGRPSTLSPVGALVEDRVGSGYVPLNHHCIGQGLTGNVRAMKRGRPMPASEMNSARYPPLSVTPFPALSVPGHLGIYLLSVMRP